MMRYASLLGPDGSGEFAAWGGTALVPARRPDIRPQPSPGGAGRVRSRRRGTRGRMASFRMADAGAGCWTVDGVVDMVDAAAFGAAVRAAACVAVARGGVLRLRFDELELIDAGGLAALADAVRQSPDGCSVLIEGANDQVRRLWLLSGYVADGLPVELLP
jgi:ABC-type transporter Mla MlaB component